MVDFDHKLVDVDTDDILFKDHLGNTKPGYGLSTSSEAMAEPTYNSKEGIVSVEEVIVEDGRLHLRVKLTNEQFSTITLREAKARGFDVVLSWLRTRDTCWDIYNAQQRNLIEQAITEFKDGRDSSILLEKTLREYDSFVSGKIPDLLYSRKAQELNQLLLALTQLTVAGGIRQSHQVKIRLFNDLEGNLRNIFIIEQQLILIHNQHKAGNQGGFDCRNPVVLVPLKQVGSMLFVYLALVLPKALSISYRALQGEASIINRNKTKLVAFKWHHPFTVLAHELTVQATSDVLTVSAITARCQKRLCSNFTMIIRECKYRVGGIDCIILYLSQRWKINEPC